MSTFEDPWALVAANLEEGEEEEGDFDPVNIQSKIMETDLVELHSEFPIPLMLHLEVPRVHDRACNPLPGQTMTSPSSLLHHFSKFLWCVTMHVFYELMAAH